MVNDLFNQTFLVLVMIKSLKSLRLPTLSYRRYRGDMLELYKMTHKMYDQSAVGDFLEFKNNVRGHNFHLVKKYCRLDMRKFSFKLRVCDGTTFHEKS